LGRYASCATASTSWPAWRTSRGWFVALLVNRGRFCSLARLIETVWGDEPPASAMSGHRGHDIADHLHR